VIRIWETLSGLHSLWLVFKDLGAKFCLLEDRRIQVWLARESLHQVLLFLCFYVVPDMIPTL